MCDTFVAVSKATEDRSVIFGKNSDREPNESQPAKRSLNPVFNLYWKKQNKIAGLKLT